MRTTPLAPLWSVRRSVDLFRAFRVEQTDPDHFYGLLAADSARQVAHYADLADSILLDVGGGPGYFASAFRERGARYVAIDADLGELSARSTPEPGTVLGSGTALPIRTGTVDVCYSSNVLEHVVEPEVMADEMVRVTRTGGTVFLSYTLWWGPWGGHETAPWHYLGGYRAAERYAQRHGHRPKNDFGTSLFALGARRMLRWAQARAADGSVEIVTAIPRYHPRWAAWTVRVPILRELVVWNLAIVLRVR